MRPHTQSKSVVITEHYSPEKGGEGEASIYFGLIPSREVDMRGPKTSLFRQQQKTFCEDFFAPFSVFLTIKKMGPCLTAIWWGKKVGSLLWHFRWNRNTPPSRFRKKNRSPSFKKTMGSFDLLPTLFHSHFHESTSFNCFDFSISRN